MPKACDPCGKAPMLVMRKWIEHHLRTPEPSNPMSRYIPPSMSRRTSTRIKNRASSSTGTLTPESRKGGGRACEARGGTLVETELSFNVSACEAVGEVNVGRVERMLC